MTKAMIAGKYNAAAVTFPALAQPKLDGIRCLASIKNGKVTLTSKNGNVFKGLEHIAAELSGYGDMELDGELYLPTGFQSLLSVMGGRKSKAAVQYHVFDMLADAPFAQRYNTLTHTITETAQIKRVPCVTVSHAADVQDMLNAYVAKGFEGIMVRDPNAFYGYGLDKLKPFDDGEYTITDIPSPGVYRCKTTTGNEFKVKMCGSDYQSEEKIWLKFEKHIGKQITVRHHGFTDNGIPRHAVAVGIRNYE